MSKLYQLWDKKSDIITPSGKEFTAEEWMQRYPWTRRPGTEMVITAGEINGGRADNLNMLATMYSAQGLEIPEGATAQEILDLVEAWENRTPPEPETPDTNERIAAAMEAQLMMTMAAAPTAMAATANAAPMVRMAKAATSEHSAAFARIRSNYKRGLWDITLVRMAASLRQITEAEYTEIVS